MRKHPLSSDFVPTTTSTALRNAGQTRPLLRPGEGKGAARHTCTLTLDW
jgi:hypothetical protein